VPTSKKPIKKGLGRGFESLIPTELLDESFDPTVNQDHQVSELRNIKIDEIVVDEGQPRKQFDQVHLEELAESIREHGVLQPIIVTPHKGGYQIVAGERRYHAAKMAGINKLPALVRTLSNQHRLEISLIENLQRKDLNDMETATAYLKLRDQFNLSLEEIGRRVGGRSASAVSNKLRLLKLPGFIQQMIVDGKVTEGQVRPLINYDIEILKKIIPRIVKEEWSARKVEQFTVDLKKNRANKDMTPDRQIKEQPYKQQLKRLKNHLKTDVVIHTNSRGAGRITIKFKDEKEFERLQKLLG
jgi:ParB family transcriptional regulator, chromosome partitioning protein